jgi:hypothetical protein
LQPPSESSGALLIIPVAWCKKNKIQGENDCVRKQKKTKDLHGGRFTLSSPSNITSLYNEHYHDQPSLFPPQPTLPALAL